MAFAIAFLLVFGFGLAGTIAIWSSERRRWTQREIRAGWTSSAQALLERAAHDQYRRTGVIGCAHADAVEVWSLAVLDSPSQMVARWCSTCETQLPPLSALEQEFDIVPTNEIQVLPDTVVGVDFLAMYDREAAEGLARRYP